MVEVVIVVEIHGDSIEEESQLARAVADGLVDRGFKDVDVVATDTIYESPKLQDKHAPITVHVSDTMH